MTTAERTFSLVRRGMLARVISLVCCLGALAAVPAQAVERSLTVKAPTSAAAHEEVQVTVKARTAAGDAEHIGFLHAEYSTDGGKTWAGLCFEQHLGAAEVRRASITTGEAGVPTMVRARVAFRGGAAGDVDYSGGAIEWDGSWSGWAEPPARIVTIVVGSN